MNHEGIETQLSGRIYPNHEAIGSIFHMIDDRQTDRDGKERRNEQASKLVQQVKVPAAESDHLSSTLEPKW